MAELPALSKLAQMAELPALSKLAQMAELSSAISSGNKAAMTIF